MTALPPAMGLSGPELPESVDWHPQTRVWWETWRGSAQGRTFVDTDWSFLLDTALMHHAMWSKQAWTLAAEVRLRAAKFGATPEDRARLRISVQIPGDVDPDAERAAATVADLYRKLTLADRKRRLTQGDPA